MNEEIRRLFPVTKNYIYLNHAAVAPISLPVYESIERYARELLEHGLVHYRKWYDEISRVRELAAGFIGAGPDEIAFAPGTSAGLSMIANGIDWRPGDNVVVPECEFPANVIPWRRIASEYGVELRRTPERDGRIETGEILGLIDDRTRVVSLSFVEYASGFRNDLAAIGRRVRECDAIFVVDAIQGLGALRLDVRECSIDALSADGHKFLLGPDGCALFFVSKRILDRIRPTLVGWMSVARPFDFGNADQPWAPAASRFEPGALNTAGILALGAAIELFQQVGKEKIEAYLIGLGDYLCDRVAEKGYQVVSSRRAGEKSAVICIRHDRHSAESLYAHLEEHRIITTHRLGRLRISPHFYNTSSEIDRLVDTLPG
ncbi:MAG: aminotransferase class V-fold PLP-dependent enzyme [Acidobacteriota bacterium]|nr:MAG: aminotransferase class V-fold PLP-dependent enzyme [Acidobacteriota bacterium]